MKKMFLIVIFLLILISILIFFYFSPRLVNDNLKYASVCLNEKCFKVEVAETVIQRERGLMYRKSLDDDKGMLFVFGKEAIYPFWMKNTLIALDIIWLDSDGKVVFINENTQPCKNFICSSINPATKARYVLEVNSGICQKVRIKVGDQFDIKK